MKSKKYSQHTFSKPMSVIWNVIRDIKITCQIFQSRNSNILPEPIFLEGENSYEPSSIFVVFDRATHSLAYTRVENCIETDYFCEISWTIFKTEPINRPYSQKIQLSTISNKRTLLVCELIYFTNQIPENDVYQTYYDKLEKIISLNRHMMTHFGGIKLDVSFDFSKLFLMSSKLLKSILKVLISISKKEMRKEFRGRLEAERVKFDEAYEKGQIHFKINQSTNESNFCSVSILCQNKSKFILPEREIIMEFFAVNKNTCFLAVRHNFKKEINENLINFMNKFKKHFLSRLKEIIEAMFSKNSCHFDEEMTKNKV